MTRFGPLRILLAEDDEDDHTLIRMALRQAAVPVELTWVQDGEDLLEHLRGAVREGVRLPDLVLLDLNMPRMDGREALEVIRGDEDLERLPVVVLTTSGAERDIETCYAIGANSYVQKPSDFTTLASALKVLVAYWAEVVTLPYVADTSPQPVQR